MLIVAALAAWLLAVIFAGWLVHRTVIIEETPAAPPDPIVALVDKWAHDWERGRA